MKRFIIVLLILVLIGTVFFCISSCSPGEQKVIPGQSENTPGNSAPPANKPTKDILLVNADHPLPKDYRPEKLVNMFEQKDRNFELEKSTLQISETVYKSMVDMFAAAKKDGVKGFIVTHGYRTSAEQQRLYAAATDGSAAKPGASEHEAGLAFDVATIDHTFELTPQFKWISTHCAEYGFILRYPKGLESVTGYPYESWHYRYVGKDHAVKIMSQGITLEQYLSAE